MKLKASRVCSSCHRQKLFKDFPGKSGYCRPCNADYQDGRRRGLDGRCITDFGDGSEDGRAEENRRRKEHELEARSVLKELDE